jgi:hypothetical protein
VGCVRFHCCRSLFLLYCVFQVCEAAFGRGNDDDAHFWHAVALTAEGSATEAIRELDPLQNNPEMALAVNAALINAHRSAKGQGTSDNKRARASAALRLALMAGRLLCCARALCACR